VGKSFFADAHGFKRTLHTYAEQLLLVRVQEIIVFWKHEPRRGGQ
jgi:hypothetical protein